MHRPRNAERNSSKGSRPGWYFMRRPWISSGNMAGAEAGCPKYGRASGRRKRGTKMMISWLKDLRQTLLLFSDSMECALLLCASST